MSDLYCALCTCEWGEKSDLIKFKTLQSEKVQICHECFMQAQDAERALDE